MMKADGFDEAIIGVGRQFDKPDRLIYDYDKCLVILMLDQDFTEEDAIEWMEYNVLGAYVGEGTPMNFMCWGPWVQWRGCPGGEPCSPTWFN